MKLVIVTGMSGAGKTIALKVLEDLGFYCVDNLPISLADKFVQLVSGENTITQAALGMDIRSGEDISQLDDILKGWREKGLEFSVLFLEASDAALIKRFKETRRSHPLSGTGRLDRGIEKERLYHRYQQAPYKGAAPGTGEDLRGERGLWKYVCYRPFLWLQVWYT